MATMDVTGVLLIWHSLTSLAVEEWTQTRAIHMKDRCVLPYMWISSSHYFFSSSCARQLGTCRFSYKTIGAKMRAYIRIIPGDEKNLQAAVAYHGPVSAAVDASQNIFRVR